MIKKPMSIRYSMTDEELEYLNKQAFEISQCPVRGYGRTQAECFQASKAGSVLEFALVHQGGIKNPKEFDVSDPDSYAWDILWDGGKTEIKRKKFLNNDNTKFYSTRNMRHIQTFLRNVDIVDQFAVGDYRVLDDNLYEVEWMCITSVGKDFLNYFKESLYNPGQMVYYHNRDPKCQYLMEEPSNEFNIPRNR